MKSSALPTPSGLLPDGYLMNCKAQHHNPESPQVVGLGLTRDVLVDGTVADMDSAATHEGDSGGEKTNENCMY